MVQVNSGQVLVVRIELGKRKGPLRALCCLGEDVKLMLARKLKT